MSITDWVQIITAVTAVVMAILAYKTYLQPPEQISGDEPTGLHCYINDTRENKGGPQWTIPKAEIGNILAFNQFTVNPSVKVKTGTFNIGQKKNWFYTKSYFPEPEFLHGVLHHLLKNANS
jgi:hypothetical protein